MTTGNQAVWVPVQEIILSVFLIDTFKLHRHTTLINDTLLYLSMKFLKLSVGIVRVRHVLAVLHIRVSHGTISWTRGSSSSSRICTWLFIRGLDIAFSFLFCNINNFLFLCDISNIGDNVDVAFCASRDVWAFILDDFLKYIVQYSFRIVWVIYLPAYT